MDFLEPFDWFGDHLVDAVDAVVGAIEDAVDWVRRLHEDWQLIDLSVWVVPEYTPVRPEPPTYFPISGITGPTGVTGVTGVTCACGLDHRAQYEEYEASRAQREIEYQETVERYKQAEGRAAQLLWDVLSPQQRETYEQYNWFEVVTHGRRFRVYYINTSNIVEYSSITGGPLKTWCIVPNVHDIPLSDALVSQKLMLDTAPGMIYRIGVAGQYDPFRFNRVAERQSERYHTDIARGLANTAFARHDLADLAEGLREYRDAIRRQTMLEPPVEPESVIPGDDGYRPVPIRDAQWWNDPIRWPYEAYE